MSLHRDDIEGGIDDLLDAAGELVSVTRGEETISVYAVVEKPTRIIEGGEGIFLDTPRQPFVIRTADYKFDNVPVEPTRTDRIEYRGKSYQPMGENTTSHVDPGPFRYVWRVYTIEEGDAS